MSQSESPAGNGPHRYSRDAMATVFEIIVSANDAQYARQAAFAAFDELDLLEEQLSRFIPSSDIARVNALRAGQSVRVGIAALECLQLAARVCDETGGAFDVTLGSKGALEIVPEQFVVRAKADGVQVDLGGIAKGHAVDRLAEVLADWSIEAALIHAGQSTALAVGPPGDLPAWPLALRHPAHHDETLLEVHLRDRALSGSGHLVHGDHIIDPRTGRPVEGRAGAWAAAPSAAMSDALSTAFMVMSVDEVQRYCDRHADISGMVAAQGPSGIDRTQFGAWA